MKSGTHHKAPSIPRTQGSLSGPDRLPCRRFLPAFASVSLPPHLLFRYLTFSPDNGNLNVKKHGPKTHNESRFQPYQCHILAVLVFPCERSFCRATASRSLSATTSLYACEKTSVGTQQSEFGGLFMDHHWKKRGIFAACLPVCCVLVLAVALLASCSATPDAGDTPPSPPC